MADRLEIDVGPLGTTSGLAYSATEGTSINATLVLAHGAGAPQYSRFMADFASALASRGVGVLTFNFLYTEQRRRIPDRTEALEACFRAAIAAARSHPPFSGTAIFTGGKSMGGRIATHLAAQDGLAPDNESQMIDPQPRAHTRGVVLLGYPLHPPGKPAQLRSAHLPDIRVPMLFVQGARDPFGTPDELGPILDRLVADVTLHVVENGDHSLAPPKRGPVSVDAVYARIQDTIAAWIGDRTLGSRA